MSQIAATLTVQLYGETRVLDDADLADGYILACQATAPAPPVRIAY